MDYPCAKFADFSFSHYGFIVQTQNDRQDSRRREYSTVAGD